MNRYWLSWVQPTADYRPLTDPPAEGIIGWWCSGETESGHATICALVEALNATHAKLRIQASWPEAETAEWRFCNPRQRSFVPGDRFPMEPWMEKRLRKANG